MGIEPTIAFLSAIPLVLQTRRGASPVPPIQVQPLFFIKSCILLFLFHAYSATVMTTRICIETDSGPGLYLSRLILLETLWITTSSPGRCLQTSFTSTCASRTFSGSLISKVSLFGLKGWRLVSRSNPSFAKAP